jgi:hypothetical protein
MPALANSILGSRLTVLNKGESSTGKTIAACSFARPNSKVYVFDIDNRMQSVFSYYKKHAPEFLEWIYHDPFRSWLDINNKIDYFVKHGCPYGTLVLSSVTSLSRLITTESIGLRREGGGVKENDALGNELKVGNIPVNAIQDYKAENNGIALLLTKLVYSKAFADVNIFVDAHLMEWRVEDIKDPKKVKIHRKILTAGKAIAEEIPVYLNEKWVFSKGIGQTGDNTFICKFRGIPEDDVDDGPATTFMELPNSIDWTNKIFSYELGKYIPKFAKENV